jgi:hypothetical protein
MVGGLLSIALIIEAPCRNHINCEGMGTAVRNVKHTKGWHKLVIFKFYLKSETETALGQWHSCLRLKLSEDTQIVLSTN